MAKDFIPSPDAEFLGWSSHYSAGINADPPAIGLTALQSAAYQTLHDQFASCLAVATNPATRTRGTIAAKSEKKAETVALARELARIINAFPATTNQQRLDLGLNPRDNEPTPIPAPEDPPTLSVVSVFGRRVKVKLQGLDTSRRGKPNFVDGATVMSYVGHEPPADTSLWVFQGSTTRTTFEIEFPPTVASGSRVWLTAFWFSPRSESGPACLPIGTYLGGGVTAPLPEAA